MIYIRGMTSNLETEILWDTWGVPHIFAPNDPEVFRAMGWAQMQAHGNLLSRLYGIARGRGAEYWGERYLESDILLHRMGLPGRASEWWALQTPEMRANLEAFIAGANAHATAHPDHLDPAVRAVLPLRPTDLMAHILRVYFVYLTQLGQRPLGAPFNDLLLSHQLFPDGPSMGTGVAGSNAWAIAPGRTRHGHALLLANPHLYWGDFHTFFEVHLNAPGLELYGVMQVGWPLPRYGFNAQLGWAHTVNTLKGWDAFALEVNQDGTHYHLDDQWLPFERQELSLAVRGDEGMRTHAFTVLRSLHGPVVAHQEGKPVALRVVGVDQAQTPGIFEQYWCMARSRNLAEFQSALGMAQNPMFTVMYADAEGNILHKFGGLVPRRKGGGWLDWAPTLPGNRRDLIWEEVHSFEELPEAHNPTSGWLQNANNGPWLTTLPAALDPGQFPAYMAPQGLTPREQRSLQMLANQPQATLESVLESAGSTLSETALRLVPSLVEAASQSDHPLARSAAQVLAQWDRRYEPDSAGAALFAQWLLAMQPRDRMLSNVFAEPWDASRPLQTPQGLAQPDLAVERLVEVAAQWQAQGIPLERTWGQIARIRRGRFDFPGHGLLDPYGVFRSSGFVQDADGRFRTVFGTTYIAAIEFARPVRAQVLLAYGNSSQADSPHFGDQLELFAHKQMRNAWLTRAEIEAHLQKQEWLPAS